MFEWTPEKETRFAGLVREVKEKHSAVGIAAALIRRDGTLLYEGFFGERDEERHLPIDGDTIFGIASCTKSFTCLAVTRLEEEGKLSPDDPVSLYIPEFIGRNQPGLKIWHLMSHSGGFFPLKRIVVDQVAADLGISDESENDLAFSDKLAAEGSRRVAERLDAQTAESGLIGRPGEYFSYCNDGYGLLSEIIRRVSGQPYAAYLKEKILKPLGMTRSGCDFVRPSRDADAAVLYRTKDGKRIADRNYHDNAFVLNGGGAMKSTLNDMKRYLLMYLGEGTAPDGTVILPPGAMRRFCRPMIQMRPEQAYARGQVVTHWGPALILGHNGSLPGVPSAFSWSKELGAGAVVLCNTSGVPASLLCEAMLRLYMDQPILPERIGDPSYHWNEESCRTAPGIYSSGEGTRLILKRNEDGSWSLENGAKTQTLIPVNENTGIIRGEWTDEKVILYLRDREVFAIRSGARMIPKEKEAAVCL